MSWKPAAKVSDDPMPEWVHRLFDRLSEACDPAGLGYVEPPARNYEPIDVPADLQDADAAALQLRQSEEAKHREERERHPRTVRWYPEGDPGSAVYASGGDE